MLMSHNLLLVALSLIVSIQASYVGLSLSIRVPEADGAFRRLLLAGAALSLATGIWGMHFVGMLALKVPFNVDFICLHFCRFSPVCWSLPSHWLEPAFGR